LPIDGAYTAPFVPVLPAVGIYFNFVLAWEATPMTWVNMALYSGVGAGIYFGYGINHARLE
jgi:APA family basic amino acid/polyamine antiporter